MSMPRLTQTRSTSESIGTGHRLRVARLTPATFAPASSGPAGKGNAEALRSMTCQQWPARSRQQPPRLEPPAGGTGSPGTPGNQRAGEPIRRVAQPSAQVGAAIRSLQPQLVLQHPRATMGHRAVVSDFGEKNPYNPSSRRFTSCRSCQVSHFGLPCSRDGLRSR